MIDELWDRAVKILLQDYPSTAKEYLAADDASRKIFVGAYEKDYELEGPPLGLWFDANEYWPDPGTVLALSIRVILKLR